MELIERARFALAHPAEARRIAEAGHQRVRRDGHSYVDRARVVREVLLG